MKDNLLILLKGFLMGAADIVPGISGGTVAFVTGIYERLINSLSSLDKDLVKLVFKLDFKAIASKIDLKFLILLFTGIGSAIIIMSRVIHYCLLHFPEYTWSLFLGVILATIFIIAKNVESSLKAYSSMLGGVILANIIINLSPITPTHSLLSIYVSGLIAICAMLLPGISGAFILLILGKYEFITSVLKNPLLGDHWSILFIFCLGCLTGLLTFSKLLKVLLTKFRNNVFAFLIGIMMGSLLKIWPWKQVLDSKIIRGKLHILKETPFFPSEINGQVIACFAIIIFSCILLCVGDFYITKKNK